MAAWRSVRSRGFGAEPGPALDEAAGAGFRAVHPFVASVTPELVERAHAAGLGVNVWTVNAPEDLRAMIGLGVDTVITDRLPRRPRDRRAATRADARERACHRAEWQLHAPGPQRWSAMNVVVCVKQIPIRPPGALKPDTKTLDRSGKLIMDDSDNYGVEMALQLASGEGDEVTLVSMAPGGETSGLRTGLAMGAAKAILVSDDTLAGSDALGTPRCSPPPSRATPISS